MKIEMFILACSLIYGGYGGDSFEKREPVPEPCVTPPIVCVFDGSSEICYPVDPEPPCAE